MQVIWRRASDSNPLTVGRESFRNDNGRIMSEHEPGSDYWNLLIHQVQLGDAGVYECQVSSKLRHLRHHVLLEVHGQSDTACGWLARLLRLVARVTGCVIE